MTAFIASFRALAVFTVLTGVLYPLLISAVGWVAFPEKASGSLLERRGEVVGSSLLAQKVENPTYFWFRPSGGDYATVASGASNLSPTSQKFIDAVEERKKRLGAHAPADLLTTSGSGLDPHLSPEGALYQVSRIAEARHLNADATKELHEIVKRNTEEKTFGLFGSVRVNVMRANLELDEKYPKP